MALLNNIRDSMVLACAYAIGQGGVFLSQILAANWYGKEILGVAVLIVSLLSFSIQFSDFGTVTVVVKKISRDLEQEAFEYIVARTVAALFFSIVFCLFSRFYFSVKEIDGLVYVCVPFFGFLQAISCSGCFEAKGNYKRFVIPQIVVWSFVALMIQLVGLRVPAPYIMGVVFFGVICSVRLSIPKEYIVVLLRSKLNVTNLKLALAVSLGPVSNQFWGRSVVFFVATGIGLTTVGALGILKAVQVAFSLSLSFLCRPILARTIRERSEDFSLLISTPEIAKNYLFPIVMSLFSPVLYFLIVIAEKNGFVSVEYSRVAIVLLVVPFWFLSLIHVQLNQVVLKRKYMVISDVIGLFLNVSSFFVFYKQNPVIAIAVGEIVHALTVVILSRGFYGIRRTYENR